MTRIRLPMMEAVGIPLASVGINGQGRRRFIRARHVPPCLVWDGAFPYVAATDTRAPFLVTASLHSRRPGARKVRRMLRRYREPPPPPRRTASPVERMLATGPTFWTTFGKTS